MNVRKAQKIIFEIATPPIPRYEPDDPKESFAIASGALEGIRRINETLKSETG